MRKSRYIQFEDGSAVLKKEKKIGVKELSISIALALILFISLLVIESKMLGAYQKSTVIIAKCTIPKSTQISQNNIDLYFSEKEIESNIIPPSAVVDKEYLLGKVVSYNIMQGEIIVNNRFSDENKYLKNIKTPVEVGINVSESSQIAGGIIRKGDFINIYVVDSSSKDSSVVLKNIYVSKAFDKNGLEITDSGSDVQSLSLNLFIDSSEEQYFDQVITSGTVFISKVLYEPSEEATNESYNNVHIGGITNILNIPNNQGE